MKCLDGEHRFEPTTVVGQENEEQTCCVCGRVEERVVFRRDARGHAVTVGEWRGVRGAFGSPRYPLGRAGR